VGDRCWLVSPTVVSHNPPDCKVFAAAKSTSALCTSAGTAPATAAPSIGVGGRQDHTAREREVPVVDDQPDARIGSARGGRVPAIALTGFDGRVTGEPSRDPLVTGSRWTSARARPICCVLQRTEPSGLRSWILRDPRIGSPSRFQAWGRRQTACALDDWSSCPRTSPHRLTLSEVKAIREMVTSPEYRHVATGTLAVLAQERPGRRIDCHGRPAPSAGLHRVKVLEPDDRSWWRSLKHQWLFLHRSIRRDHPPVVDRSSRA
jgi:hypothetical protein